MSSSCFASCLNVDEHSVRDARSESAPRKRDWKVGLERIDAGSIRAHPGVTKSTVVLGDVLAPEQLRSSLNSGLRRSSTAVSRRFARPRQSNSQAVLRKRYCG